MYNHIPYNEYYIPYVTDDGKIELSVWDNRSEKDAKRFAEKHNAPIFDKDGHLRYDENGYYHC